MLLAEVFLKLETLQRTGSFKVRGALVKLDSLSAAQRKKGVIAVSAGNHAQGVALHAQRLGTAGDDRHAGRNAVHQDRANPRLWRPGADPRRHGRRVRNPMPWTGARTGT